MANRPMIGLLGLGPSWAMLGIIVLEIGCIAWYTCNMDSSKMQPVPICYMYIRLALAHFSVSASNMYWFEIGLIHQYRSRFKTMLDMTLIF